MSNTKITDGGLWMWQDRTSSGYTNWDLGQPGKLGHRCAVMSAVTGRWADRKCDMLSAFVCKFKSGESNHILSIKLKIKG